MVVMEKGTLLFLYLPKRNTKAEIEDVGTCEINVSDNSSNELEMPKKYDISILKVDGTVIPINILSTETIKDLKSKINQATSIPVSVIKLKFKGIELTDEKTLSEYDIKAEDNVNLEIIPCLVTVINSTGSGEYGYEQTVEVNADVLNGKKFNKWEVAAGNVTIGK